MLSMYEGPAGSANRGVELQLPSGAQKLFSTSSFDIYLAVQQQMMVINPTVYRAQQLHIKAADLDKMMTESLASDIFRESPGETPAPAQLYERTTNWEVYAATDTIIIKPNHYHPGNLTLTFNDLRILRGLAHPC